jgi:hypothetical protein
MSLRVMVYANRALGITQFLDFVHHPAFQKTQNSMFRKLDLFPWSGEWAGDIY